MLAVLILLLLSVPLLELFVIVQVAGGLGAGQTILLLVAVSVVGAWMVRRSGLGVLNQIRTRLAQGEIPGNELVDGLLILLAAAFMLTPGFLTDAVGLLMLFPPTRKAVRSILVRRYAKRVDIAGWSGAQGGAGGPRRFGAPLDAESFTKDTDDRTD
ncbi:FxsA family protein [Candidatus Poriferisodalis sp.]|uniref:FxsA family protein n=1 Tax=Candidatus Poriferisodalis sp. TaxID=3101277 RepID=UPI003B02880F